LLCKTALRVSPFAGAGKPVKARILFQTLPSAIAKNNVIHRRGVEAQRIKGQILCESPVRYLRVRKFSCILVNKSVADTLLNTSAPLRLCGEMLLSLY
jgi:hypothetical protein